MADTPAPAAPAAPEEQLAKLILDEVTGEQVSKTEYKRRQKLRQKEEEKKKKEAAAPPKPAAKKKDTGEAAEKDLNPNQYFEIRSRSIQKVREVFWGLKGS